MSMMETEVTTSVPDIKIYPYSQFYGTAFLGGPLAGGYLVAENYKAFGQPDKVRKTWIVTISSMLVLCVVGYLLRNVTSFPNLIVPVAYSSAGGALMRYLQGKQIDAHKANGGPTYHWTRAFVAGLVGLIVTLCLFLLLGFIVLSFFPEYQ